jgi:hypothetical protein
MQEMKQEAAGNRDEACGKDQQEFRRGRLFRKYRSHFISVLHGPDAHVYHTPMGLVTPASAAT